MRIVEVHERTFPISRFADSSIPSGGLDTSAVSVVTDVKIDGEPVIGYGFTSIGRFGQGGLMRDRFIPRLTNDGLDLADSEKGEPDPMRAWHAMMTGEKPGGHGERSVAVGGLDMAIWDAVAKAAGLPLYRYLQRYFGRKEQANKVKVYAGGGYYYPENDQENLRAEIKAFADAGFTKAKIKVGAKDLKEDVVRTEIAAETIGSSSRLAVDAIYSYDHDDAIEAARLFEPLDLWWFEDICDPLDFKTMAEITKIYPHPIAAGEGTFSAVDARNLITYAGLRSDRDILEFDIAHCYGIPEYLRIIAMAESLGWDRTAFVPHGGHLFTLHVATGLGLGGAEVNPFNFQPFGGLADDAVIEAGITTPPDLPGIGFEGKSELMNLFRSIKA